MKNVVKRTSSKAKKTPPEAGTAQATAPSVDEPGPLMTSAQAVLHGVLPVYGMVRVKDGFAVVRAKIKGDQAFDVTVSEADTKSATFDQLKIAIATRVVKNDPPEARWPAAAPQAEAEPEEVLQ